MRSLRGRLIISHALPVLIVIPLMGLALAYVLESSVPLNRIADELSRMRLLVAAVLAMGLLLGAGVGWLLALNLAGSLRGVTAALKVLAGEGRPAPLPGGGPEEVREVVEAYNSVVASLQAAEESRRQLLANVVHELGRPLGALRSAVQALERGAEEDPALRRELVGGIDEELARLQRTVDDLARLHDLLRGEVTVVYQTINLADWLPRTLAPWQRAAAAKGLLWEADLPPAGPAMAVDPDRLAQAIGNLLSNAIRYTPAGGKVRVDAGAAGGKIWLRVGDSGPGIPPEEQAGVFHAFYRGQTASRFPDGMGLGLTIAHDLIARHGGRLELESAPGTGSRFTIIIPLAPPDRLPV